MKIGIYCIKNIINNKIYIGQSINLEKRRNIHFYYLIKNNHCNPYLQKSFNKYGEKAFEFRILEECSEDMLDIREIAWIKHYNSLDTKNGYNLQSGGTVLHRLSEETKKKISQTMKAIAQKRPSSYYKKHSEETKAKMSKIMTELAKNRPSSYYQKASEETKKKMSLVRQGKNNPFYGKTHTPEAREKLRLVNLGKKRSSESIKKFQETMLRKRVNKKKESYFCLDCNKELCLDSVLYKGTKRCTKCSRIYRTKIRGE